MGQWNADKNVAVWFDIPVSDLSRAAEFYAAVLGIKVHIEKMDDFSFGVLDHEEGNGGCLVPRPEEVSDKNGILLYLNVNNRIQKAVAAVQKNGGQILNGIHAIGPHGFRAIVLDSEGNRLALHSNTDA